MIGAQYVKFVKLIGARLVDAQCVNKGKANIDYRSYRPFLITKWLGVLKSMNFH